MGVSGVGDRVTARRGELVGAQGVLSAKWLVRKNGSMAQKVAMNRASPRFTLALAPRHVSLFALAP